MIGEKVSHFLVLEKLGEGGMGVVYKARDLSLDRIVALKFLPRQLTANPNEKERFYHEGRAASALNHPNITTVYEIQETEGQIFLAMECVEGVTLKHYLQTNSPSIPEILDIAIQICSGLAAAHRRGIVHRDIKADNILITASGDVKITDFGLAKLQGASRLTEAGSTIGTAAYMSPEQAQGTDIDERSDIFSSGVVLYELLTGRLPFRGDHHAAILYAVVNEQPLPVARFNDKVSPEVERIVAKALAKDRDERYQHADEMLADLKRERKNLEHLSYEQVHKTVPFVTAPPDATRVASHASTASPAPIESATIDASGEKSKVKHSRARRRLLRFLVPSVGLLILVILLLVFNPFNLQMTLLKGNAAEEDRTLAVLYFQNIPDPEDKDHTGDMLTDLMTTALSQDKALQVVSRERLYSIEKDLGQGEVRSISPSMAEKVAERAGVSMMLIGSVLERTPSLVVTARLVNVKSGNIISSQRLSGFSTQGIFSLIDTLALLVRSDLSSKISLPSATETKSVADVTTNSPEAYRLYLIGEERSRRFLAAEAKAALNQAIALDSNFAMAYFALASREIADEVGRRALLKKARDLDGHVTEKERLRIEAEYLEFVEGKTQQAAGVLEDFVRKYPLEMSAYYQLAVTYTRLGEVEKALETYQRALQRDPMEKDLWNDIAYTYAGLNRRAEAFDAADRYLRLLPAEPNPYDSKGELYMMFGEVDSAVIWYKKTLALRPDFQAGEKLGWISVREGDYDAARKMFYQFGATSDLPQKDHADLDQVVILLHQGKLRQAQAVLLKEIPTLDRVNSKTPYLRAVRMLFVVARELGDVHGMTRYADLLDATEKDRLAEPVGGRDLIALALEARGDAEGAARVTEDLGKDVQGREVPAQFRYAHVRALLAESEERYTEAVEIFRKAFGTTYPLRAPDLPYAIALFQAGQIDQALEELKRLVEWVPISYPPINLSYLPMRPGWPIDMVEGHYWLGMAFEKKGKKTDAIREYKNFLGTWKEADFQSREMKDASARLARLTGMANP